MDSRHKLWELAVTSLYQHFLSQKDIKECVYDNSETNEVDPFLYMVTVDATRYQDVYIDKINAVFHKDWTSVCLGLAEQVTLMMVACELDSGTAPKAIVIDEAITLAKKYCDDETHHLINGVLDRL